MKLPGYEQDVVDAIERHGLGERALVSTAFARSSRRLARVAPALPRAIGYPRDRLGVSRIPLAAGADAGRARRRCGRRCRFACRVLLRGRARDVLSLHHTLCSRPAVAASPTRWASPVLGWTVNDPAAVRRLAPARRRRDRLGRPWNGPEALATLPGP